MRTTTFGNERETFGIKDRETGKMYKDILSSFIQNRNLYKPRADYWVTHIFCNGIDYRVRMDEELTKALTALPVGDNITLVVSFQRRTTGDFAIARLYKAKLDPRGTPRNIRLRNAALEERSLLNE